MGVTAERTVRGPNRRVAGLALGGLTSVYWLAAARPLLAVLVGSLVVAGERANGPTGFGGRIPLRAVPAIVAAELVIALRAAVTGAAVLGLVAGLLFLLAVWLTGPSLGPETAFRHRPADGGR